MRPFAIWLAIVVVTFGAYAAITTALRDTTQVFVFVDSSFQMEEVWGEVPRELDRIDDRDHAEFTLAHGQSRSTELVHSWQPELELTGVVPFAPCDLTGAAQFTEADEADELIVITTTANTCDTSALGDWEVVELVP